MKFVFPFLFFFLFTVVFPALSFGQTVPGSAEYMDEVSPAFDKIKVKTWDYLSVIAQGRGAFLVESSRQSLLEEIRDAKEEMMLAPSFNGSDEFRMALVEYFETTHAILSEDFDAILDMEAISEQTYDAMETYLTAKERANQKLDEAYFHLLKAQKKFADENKLILHRPADDEMTRKIEQTGKTLSYYNKIYLIFFRVFKQENLMMYAIQKDDFQEFEFNNRKLEFETNLALEKLALISPFQGDSSLIVAVKANLEFYKREATSDAVQTANYYATKQKYTEGKAAFEKIPQEELTQADADQINTIGRAYNESMKTHQNLMRSQKQERVEKLKLWNNAVELFFQKHRI